MRKSDSTVNTSDFREWQQRRKKLSPKLTREASEMREARDSDNRVEVRNYDNRLLGKLDVDAGIFEIAIKGCVTLMKIPPGTKIEFVHQPTNP